MKTIIIVTFVSLCFGGCAKIYEDVRIKRIQRPEINIDSIVSPDWELPPPLPPTDDPIGN